MKTNKKNGANTSTKQRPAKVNQQRRGKQASDNDADARDFEGEDPNTAVRNNIGALDGVSHKYSDSKPKAIPVSKREENLDEEDINYNREEDTNDEFADDNENEEDFNSDEEDEDDDEDLQSEVD